MSEKMRTGGAKEDLSSVEPLVRELAKRKDATEQADVLPEIDEEKDRKPELGQVFAVWFDGQLIKGTIASIEQTEQGMTIELDDITHPEMYKNRYCAFTLRTHSSRWELVKK